MEVELCFHNIKKFACIIHLIPPNKAFCKMNNMQLDNKIFLILSNSGRSKRRTRAKYTQKHLTTKPNLCPESFQVYLVLKFTKESGVSCLFLKYHTNNSFKIKLSKFYKKMYYFLQYFYVINSLWCSLFNYTVLVDIVTPNNLFLKMSLKVCLEGNLQKNHHKLILLENISTSCLVERIDKLKCH